MDSDRSKSRSRESQKQGNPKPLVDEIELHPYNETPKARDFGDSVQPASEADIRKIVEPDAEVRHASKTQPQANSKSGRGSRTQSDDESGKSSPRSARSLRTPNSSGSNDGHPSSPMMDFLQDTLMPYLPRRKISVSSAQSSKGSPKQKDPKPLKQKVKGWLGAEDDEQARSWDLSLLQEHAGKKSAPDMPDRWIKFSLPVSLESGREYIRWSGSESYSFEEKRDWPWPFAAFLYGTIPPRPKRKSQLMVVFRITSHNDELTAGQVEACARTLRFLSDKVSLRADVRFDVGADSELSKPEHQTGIKEMLEKAIRKATAKKSKVVDG